MATRAWPAFFIGRAKIEEPKAESGGGALGRGSNLPPAGLRKTTEPIFTNVGGKVGHESMAVIRIVTLLFAFE